MNLNKIYRYNKSTRNSSITHIVKMDSLLRKVITRKNSLIYIEPVVKGLQSKNYILYRKPIYKVCAQKIKVILFYFLENTNRNRNNEVYSFFGAKQKLYYWYKGKYDTKKLKNKEVKEKSKRFIISSINKRFPPLFDINKLLQYNNRNKEFYLRVTDKKNRKIFFNKLPMALNKYQNIWRLLTMHKQNNIVNLFSILNNTNVVNEIRNLAIEEKNKIVVPTQTTKNKWMSKIKTDDLNIKVLDNSNSLFTLALHNVPVYKKTLDFQFIRLYYPYSNARILSKYISINTKTKRFFRLSKSFAFKLPSTFVKYNVVSPFYSTMLSLTPPLLEINNNDDHILPSYFSGLKIQLSGRLTTQFSIPRKTVYQKSVGAYAFTKEPNKLPRKSITIGKNRKGSYSIKTWLGQTSMKK